MRDLTLLATLVALLPVALRAPQVCVLLWGWSALLAPNQFMYGALADVELGKVIAALTFVVLMAGGGLQSFRLDRTAGVLIVLLLVGTAGAETAISATTWNWELYAKLAKVLVFAFVIMAVMSTRVRIHALLWTIALALGYDAVTEGLMYIVSGGAHAIGGKANIGDNNNFALAVLMTIPLMFYLARYSKLRLVRWCVGAVNCLAVVAVIGTSSRGGFIGLAVIAAFYIAYSRYKAFGIAIVAAAAVAGLFLLPESFFHRMDTIGVADSDSSFMGRVIAWKISTLIALDHPFFGGGFHALHAWPVWHSYSSNFHLLDFIPTDLPDDSPHAAHSIYFEILGDLGFSGLVTFVTLLAISFLNLRHIKRLTRDRPELIWATDLATAFQVALIVYCISGAALSMAYYELLYVEVAMVASLRGLVIGVVGAVVPASLAARSASRRFAEFEPVRRDAAALGGEGSAR